MATATDVLNRAKSQVGYKEYPYGSNHTKYGAWYGLDHEPWCAMFVSWCFYFSGAPLKISTPKGYSYCPAGVDWFKHRGLWRSSRYSKPGDVAFFNFHGGYEAQHTGIILSNNPMNSYVTTVEGNTGYTSAANGGEVLVMHRPRSVLLGTGNTQGWLLKSGSTPAKPVPVASWQKDGYTHTELRIGAKGRNVTHMQNLLLKHGQNIVSDGVFGPHTKACLISYQKSHGLTGDGVCGPHTWDHLHH